MGNKKLIFHHIGIPVDKSVLGENKRYSELLKMYSEVVENDLGIRVEYHAFDEGCPLDKRIQTQKHVAFKVSDIEKELQGKEIVMPLYEPFAGYRCAIVVVNNVLIELIETRLSEKELWNDTDILKKGILYGNQDFLMKN